MSTLPTTPGFTSINLTSNQPVIVDVSESGKRQSRLVGGHLWQLKVVFPTMTYTQFAPIDAFIMGLDGELTDFDLTYPYVNQGDWVDDVSPLVKGAVSAGATSVIIDGLTVGAVVKAGDIFRSASHVKVYKVIADAIADGTGAATVDVRPAFIEALANNEAITHTGVTFNVALKGVHEFKMGAPSLVRYELDCEESL